MSSFNKNIHWRVQLQNDLKFHSFLNAVFLFQNKDIEEENLKYCISLNDLYAIAQKKPSPQISYSDIFLNKKHLDQYLSRFSELKILSFNETVIDLDFSSRSLLVVANRLHSSVQSTARVESEVFKFIRGSLVFDSTCVKNIKIATQLISTLYENKTKNILTENELLLQLNAVIQFNLSDKTPEIIRAFIEVGFAKRLFSLGRQRNTLLNISGKGNIWFLLSSLFGLHSDIEGLPFLFFGTLPIYNPPGNNIFIRGGLGCGKSTLASQLAYEVADKGGVSIYLALEQNTAILENLYASFGWTNNEDVEFKKIQLAGKDSKNQLLDTLNEYNEGQKGLFILASILLKDFTDMRDLIDIICSDFLHKLKRTQKLIVLDPINAVKIFQDHLPEQQLRQSMVCLLEKIQFSGCCSILVGEEHTNENSPFFFEESISDTTIRLFFSEENYKKRTIEVCKSRIVPCVRGDNRFIIDQKGIIVYPSASSYIAARQGRRYNAIGKKGKMQSGVEGLDEMFGDKGIESGTITSFIGEAGTGKMELALCWLSNNGVPHSNEASIYVTFSKAPSSSLSLLKNRAKVVFQHLKNKGQNFDDLFSIISLKTDGLTAGQIIHEISTEINRKKRLDNARSIRIVIDSLTQLEYSSCSDEDNRSFLCAMEDIVKTDTISCILCYTRDMYREAPTLVEQKTINISDNQLEFKKIVVSGIQKTIVFTERSRVHTHPHEAMELIINDEIKIEPNFSLFSDIRNGKTTPISTEIFLHYEGKAHREYNKNIKRFVNGAVGENVTVHNQLYPEISKNLIIRRGMLEKSIRLVSVDDLDLDLLTDADYHPIPISMLDIKFDFLKCVTKRIRSKTNNKYYRALPLYVNLPVLLCEKTSENRVIKSGKPIKSWEGLANWLDLEDNDSDDNVPAFEFSKGVAENYNCMFLEILHSLVSEEQGGIKPENFASTFLKYLDKDIGNKAAFLFWRLCHKAHCLSKPHKDEFSKKDQKRNKPKPDALEILQINPSFSFCRTWFTSVYDIFERNKDSYNIKTLPGTGAVLGTWYLTVPKSGPAPDIAKKLCVALCDRDRSIERFESWIGIPPYSSLCGRKPKTTLLDYKAEESTINFARKYLSEIAESAIVRTEIPQYTTFSSLLSFYLQRILEIKKTDHEKVPKSDIEAELNAAIKAIKRI